MSSAAPPVAEDDSLSFAEDVAWVWAHIHGSVGEKKPGYTKTRKLLHDWATEKDKKSGESLVNYEAFMKWAEKAEKTIKDAKKSAVDPDDIEKAERRPIADLRQRLLAAIDASKGVTP